MHQKRISGMSLAARPESPQQTAKVETPVMGKLTRLRSTKEFLADDDTCAVSIATGAEMWCDLLEEATAALPLNAGAPVHRADH